MLKKIIFSVTIIIVGSGIYWYAISKRSTNLPKTVLTAEKQKQIYEQSALEQALEDLKKSDRDLDGLSDSDEKKYGTNADVPDTDQDGLLDNDEISRKTDPLKTDSDSDGVNDGLEIRRHTNPLLK